MANEQQNNDPNDDFVGSIVHTYPVSGGNTLPHADEMTRIMLPAIQRCWDLLSVEEREPNRFTEYMVITVVFAGSIVHTYPVSGGGNTLPHADEMTRIMLPAIQRCWDLLSEEEREPNRFTEYMVITVVFAAKAFLAQQSNKPQNSSDANG